MSCNSCCNDSKSGANLPVSINFGDNDFYIIYNPSNRSIEKVQKTNSGGPFLSQENNLSDVQSAEESRANLQVYGTDETLTKDKIQEFIRPIILIPKPSGFDYLPFDVVKYSDTVYLSNTDWLEMFKTKYAGFIGAGEVYVSQSLGDDSGTGSKAQPFQTINAAMEANASTVYILDGVFDDFLRECGYKNPNGLLIHSFWIGYEKCALEMPEIYDFSDMADQAMQIIQTFK